MDTRFANVTGGNARTFAVGGLQPQTNYTFRVRAYNGAGNSLLWSGNATVNTGGTLAAPSALQATAHSPGHIGLSWTDNSDIEQGTRIEISSDGISFGPLATITSSSQSTIAARGLNPSTTYYFRTVSFDRRGDTAPSNIASATTLPFPAPNDLTAAPVSHTQVRLVWTDNTGGEAGFYVEQSSDGLAYNRIADIPSGVEANKRAFLAQNLVPGGRYYFRLQAHAREVGSSGSYTSVYTAPVTATAIPVQLPGDPTGLVVADVRSTETRTAPSPFPPSSSAPAGWAAGLGRCCTPTRPPRSSALRRAQG